MAIRSPRLARLTGVSAAILSLLLGGGEALARAHAVHPRTVGAVAAGAPVHAAFLGDSYTYGIGASDPTDGYAYLVARAEHWTADVFGLPGSGYVRIANHDGEAIDAGIAPVIAAQPSVVVVECGHNDADPRIELADVEPRALRDLRALRAGLPQATIVVVGPVWLSGQPTRRALAVRDAVHVAQRQIPDSRWIDPIAQRWFVGRFDARTGDDATMINYAVGHPDDLGYHHIARRLEADLSRLGVR